VDRRDDFVARSVVVCTQGASHEARIEEMRTLDGIQLAHCPVTNTAVHPCVIVKTLSLLTS